MQNIWQQAEKILKKGGVVVLPTDTLYGLIGSALSKKAVERIYDIKGRDDNKPFIVLVNSIKQIESFGINISTKQAKILAWKSKCCLSMSY